MPQEEWCDDFHDDLFLGEEEQKQLSLDIVKSFLVDPNSGQDIKNAVLLSTGHVVDKLSVQKDETGSHICPITKNRVSLDASWPVLLFAHLCEHLSGQPDGRWTTHVRNSVIRRRIDAEMTEMHALEAELSVLVRLTDSARRERDVACGTVRGLLREHRDKHEAAERAEEGWRAVQRTMDERRRVRMENRTVLRLLADPTQPLPEGAALGPEARGVVMTARLARYEAETARYRKRQAAIEMAAMTRAAVPRAALPVVGPSPLRPVALPVAQRSLAKTRGMKRLRKAKKPAFIWLKK